MAGASSSLYLRGITKNWLFPRSAEDINQSFRRYDYMHESRQAFGDFGDLVYKWPQLSASSVKGDTVPSHTI